MQWWWQPTRSLAGAAHELETETRYQRPSTRQSRTTPTARTTTRYSRTYLLAYIRPKVKTRDWKVSSRRSRRHILICCFLENSASKSRASTRGVRVVLRCRAVSTSWFGNNKFSVYHAQDLEHLEVLTVRQLGVPHPRSEWENLSLRECGTPSWRRDRANTEFAIHPRQDVTGDTRRHRVF